MIKNLMLGGLPALTLGLLPVFTAAPAAYAAPAVSVAPAAPATAATAAGARAPLPLFEAIDRLPVAAEHRDGYKRDLYKHWNRGLNATDGCDTARKSSSPKPSRHRRSRPLQADRRILAHCAYDDVVVSDAARLDVDHFVPLAEVYDSEQTPWTAARRRHTPTTRTAPTR